MRLNKKAESGFMGAIIAVMVVTISLTAFLSLLPSAFEDTDDETDVPTQILGGLSIVGGTIHSDKDIQQIVEDNGITALRLILKVPAFMEDGCELNIGIPDSDNMQHISGTCIVNMDGRTVNAEYGLAVWR